MSNKKIIKPKGQAEDQNSVEKEVIDRKLSFLNFLKRQHFLIIILVILALLGVVILIMANLFQSANDTSSFSESSTVINFDQKTIDNIRNINKTSQNSINFSGSGRTNPFTK